MSETITTNEARPARVAVIAPHFACDHVRVTHKEAYGFHDRGCEVTILCRNPPADRYLGMRTLAARGPGSRLGMLLSAPTLTMQALKLNADLYLIVNPFAIMVGISIALAGRRVVYCTYEDFLQKTRIRLHVPRPLRAAMGHSIVLLEQLLSRISAATVVTQPDIKHRYVRSLLIENAPLTRGPIVKQADDIYASLDIDATPTLIYSGVINRVRGLFRMLDLVAKLNERRRWRLVLVGPMASTDMRDCAAHAGWQYVDYAGCVTHAHSLALIRSATFGLGLLADVGGYSRTSMTKLYEYMLMETPFVVSDFRRWRDSVRDLPAGLFVDPSSVSSIAAQINELYEDANRYRSMQRLGRQFIEQEFNWEARSRALHSLLDVTASSRERPSAA